MYNKNKVENMKIAKMVKKINNKEKLRSSRKNLTIFNEILSHEHLMPTGLCPLYIVL